MTAARTILRLRKLGIKYPVITYQEAKRAGLPLAYVCAVLEQETGGGRNVFGHDQDENGRPIWHGERGPVLVTKESYLKYKAWRDRLRRVERGLGLPERPPLGRMQGVGPMQLTWYTFQDEADRLGGCWKPRYNIRVGCQILARARNAWKSGLFGALAAYNGQTAYAVEVTRRQRVWTRRLA